MSTKANYNTLEHRRHGLVQIFRQLEEIEKIYLTLVQILSEILL